MQQILPSGLRASLPSPVAFSAQDTADFVPVMPGAYLILLRLDRPFAVDIPRLDRHILPPGWYAYAGSARGSGGLRARIGRHLKTGKPVHWHIDRLTPAAAAIVALAYPAGEECALISALLSRGGFAVPIPGFGASDCRACVSHLLRWTGASSAE